MRRNLPMHDPSRNDGGHTREVFCVTNRCASSMTRRANLTRLNETEPTCISLTITSHNLLRARLDV